MITIMDRIETMEGTHAPCESVWAFGRIKTRLLPDGMTKAEFEAWWPHQSERERDRYTVYETTNSITLAGRNQLLTYAGNNALTGGGVGLGNVVPFAQYFAVGTGAIISVSAGDVALNGELFRAAPSSSLISGNSVNISTFFGATQANGTYTNAGLFGNNATSSSGSGALVTHALYAFTKTSGQSLTSDYVINLN